MITKNGSFTAEEFYLNGYTNNYVVGIDQFERTFESTLGEKADKNRDVGIFYFLTLGQHDAKEIYDVTEIMKKENGVDLLFHQDTAEAPDGCTYFWGEPLYGYYNSGDTWVIRRHLELLTAAGVDFLVFDTTNAVTYDTVVQRILKEVVALKEAGYDCPELVFYTNAYSRDVILHLYDMFYKSGKYDSAWYRIDGKPLIIGNVSDEADLKEVTDRGVTGYVQKPMPQEVKDYFYFRDKQWPSDPYVENGFPWIEWTYPAPVHNGIINVAVASHPALPMSFSITRGAKNWGRGYNVNTGENESDKAYEGQFFQSCWDVAIDADPDTVFVTGWNEWTAGKFMYDGEYALVDNANMEFSRDAELMKGGYNDAFYIQLAKNIRAYKNMTISPDVQLNSEPKTIDINGDKSVWNDVGAIYRTTNNENKARNATGAAPTVRYKQAAARNNIIEVRIADDNDYFCFYIRTSEIIELRESGDTEWMNLFIGKGAVSKKGFECYEFVVGRYEENGQLVIEKLKSDYSGERIGLASYSVKNDIMQIAVPKSALSVSPDSHNIYFKIADGIEHPEDIMDYYVSGKSFPVGRLSYRYIG